MGSLCSEYLLQLTRFGRLFLCVYIFGSHDFAKCGVVLSNKCKHNHQALQGAHPKWQAYFCSGMLELVSRFDHLGKALSKTTGSGAFFLARVNSVQVWGFESSSPPL